MSNRCPDGTLKPSGDESEPDQLASLYERDQREFLADEFPTAVPWHSSPTQF